MSQRLRTLELCVDNLIGDFLDQILRRTVLRDRMEDLYSHLRPPFGNHHHAHTTIRILEILGKLGGWNRRLLDENRFGLSTFLGSGEDHGFVQWPPRAHTVRTHALSPQMFYRGPIHHINCMRMSTLSIHGPSR